MPAELLVALHGRPAERGSRSLFPSKSTLWRVLTGADAAAVDAAIGAWLHAQAAARDRADPGNAAGQEADETTLVAIAVDGKTVRGAIDADGAQVHLLAAATHGEQLVLGQVEVGVKSNEIPQFAPLLSGLAAAGVDLSLRVMAALRILRSARSTCSDDATSPKRPAGQPASWTDPSRSCSSHHDQRSWNGREATP